MRLTRDATGLALDAQFDGKYLSVTSFRRDGTGVSTPVWFVVDGGTLLFTTDAGSFKAKRIRRDPGVMIAPCTATGRLLRAPVHATARFLDASELDRVHELMARKYRLDRLLVLPVYRLVQRLRGAGSSRDRASEVGLAVTPT